MAQAAELVGVAKLVSLDDLVRHRTERAVDRVFVGAAARHLPGPAGPAGIVVAGARHHLAVSVGVAVLLGIFRRPFGRRPLHRRLRAGGGAFAAIGLVLAVGLVALALLIVGRLVELAEIEVEVLDQPARRAGVGILVLGNLVELAEVLGDLVLQPWPPQIDEFSRSGRRRFAGERFT